MKFTLSWLKEHLDTTARSAEIVDKLTMIGLEVESVEDKAALLKPFVIADVISAEKHPNADRLRVCMVDIGQVAKGEKPIQVVCGAPNARTGMKGVFSPAGTFIPGKNMTLSVGTIRGVESHGMLCSEAELLISDDHDGIIDLPADAPVGTSYAEWAGLGDPVIEINLTPNRPDCTGVNGIARDLGATLIGDYKENAPKRVAGTFPCPVTVTIAAPELCPAFGLRLVRGVKNGPSPDWLQKRLTAIGLRPINALVDITNFITFDRGRPLHVFDAGKVQGKSHRPPRRERRATAGARRPHLHARPGHLRHRRREGRRVARRHHGRRGIRLRREHHRRADRIRRCGTSSTSRRPAASSASIPTRATASSAASIRISWCPAWSWRRRWCSTSAAASRREIVVAGNPTPKEKIIDFPLSELPRLAGLKQSLADVRRVLEKLGFFAAGQGERVKVAVPSWRPDVHGRADIVEEIVRIVGVDQVPSTPFPRGDHARKPVLTPIQVRTRKAKRALAARGLTEAVTWSFISKREAELFGGGSPELALANPIAAELSDMRPSLVPGLVTSAQRNADRGFPDVGLFEVGQVFRGDKPEDQFTAATGLRRALAKPGRRRPPLGQRQQAGRYLRRQGRCLRRAGGRRRAHAGAAGGAGRAVAGCTRGAAAPSRWGRRTSSAISANCIRARWPRSAPKGRWSASR